MEFILCNERQRDGARRSQGCDMEVKRFNKLIHKECLELHTWLTTVDMMKAFTMHRLRSLERLLLKSRSMV